MKKAIVIPIYLKLSQPEELTNSEGVALAKRAIESLRALEDQDFTLILPVGFDLPEEGARGALGEMDRLIREEVRSIRRERTLVFSSSSLEKLREYLEKKGFGHFSFLVDLKGFSKIRNTGLLLAQALSMETVVFIDSDEVVEDPDYLRIACEHLVRRWRGKEVVGKGGFYLNPDGTILLSSPRLWWRFFWNKTKWMNRVWEKILSTQDRLVPSPMLLGGNLVLHRYLFRSVPFDPYIPRGEDTDYLINASQLGFCILFDRQLRIKHLHPERTETYFFQELRWDIERFLYERDKLKGGLDISLDPYPGYFLGWTIYPRAVLTSLLLFVDYLAKGKWEWARESLKNIEFILRGRDGGGLPYLKFRAEWERVMGEVQKESLEGMLESCWV